MKPARVAVFRALVLGDLLCATPALRAMRAGWPGARIALVGLPWARELTARLDSVDDFIEFPGWPGLPERPLADPTDAPRFIAAMRARRFDLALQLHGSGGIVNPLVAQFGAERTAGFADATAWRPAADAALFAPWRAHGTEVERLLGLTDHLGLSRRGSTLDFPLRDTDRREADRLLALRLRMPRHASSSSPSSSPSSPSPSQPQSQSQSQPQSQSQSQSQSPSQPHSQFQTPTQSQTPWPSPPQPPSTPTTKQQRRYAIVHAGSQLPSRRWPPERFAAVADALAADGIDIVVTGTAGEAAVTAGVVAAMRAPALDLTGLTTLWSLGALVERAALVVCNDTGISHVAAALATPSVVVSSGGDAPRWAPADASRHRVLWHDMACRPCAHAVCPVGHGCALAVETAAVVGAVRRAVAINRPAPSAPAAVSRNTLHA